jgi:hypothetical protein
MKDSIKLEKQWAKENEIRQLKVKISELMQAKEIYSARLRQLEGVQK